MTEPDARRLLSFWAAVDRAWCLPDPWKQTAQLSFCIEQLRQTLRAVNGNDPDRVKFEDWMPGRYEAPKVMVETQQDQTSILNEYVRRGNKN